MSRARARRRVATAVFSAAVALGTVGLAPAPSAFAAAGFCSGAGVNVVVDFGALGGGVRRACDPGGTGHSAAQVIAATGHSLTRVERFPGAICRVDHRPGDVSCHAMPPTDAYWGLFWSRGSGWSYSSLGVDSLRLGNGDTVALAWQASGARRSPAAAPARPAPEKKKQEKKKQEKKKQEKPGRKSSPKPAQKSSQKSSGTGSTAAAGDPDSQRPAAGSSRSGSGQASSRRGSGRPGDDPSHRPHRKATAQHAPATPSASADAGAVAGRAASATPAEDGSGLPWWLPTGVVVLLVLAGGGVALVRRRGA